MRNSDGAEYPLSNYAGEGEGPQECTQSGQFMFNFQDPDDINVAVENREIYNL